MPSHAARRVLVPAIALAVVVVLAGATSALVGHRQDATSGREATASLSLSPGTEQVVPWVGSKRRAGLSLRAPGEPLSVGLQVRSDRRGSSGYRASVALSSSGAATAVLSRVRHGEPRMLRTATLPGRWNAGSVIRVDTRVAGRPGRVTVRLRAWVDGSPPSAWIKAVDHGIRTKPPGRAVLVVVALDSSAAAPIGLEVGPLRATYGPPSSPSVSASASPTPPTPSTTPAPPEVPSDGFGPLGEPMSANDRTELGWDGIEAPSPERVTVLADGVQLGGGQPSGKIWRADAHAGEVYVDGRSRSEVYGRRATPWSTPASQWPDPPGAERWYTFSVYVPAAFPVATDATWFDLTQWKGYRGGSPPIALEIKRNRWRLGGARANDDLIVQDDIGPITFGAWTRFTVGLSYSTSADDGWVQVFRNGKEVLTRTPVATMDTYQGQPDPVYLKQGIYRSTGWKVDQALFFSPVVVNTAQPAAP